MPNPQPPVAQGAATGMGLASPCRKLAQHMLAVPALALERALAPAHRQPCQRRLELPLSAGWSEGRGKELGLALVSEPGMALEQELDMAQARACRRMFAPAREHELV